MKYLLTGSGGFLGTRLAESLKKNDIELIEMKHKDCDISNMESLETFMHGKENLDGIVHLAGCTTNVAGDLFEANIRGLYNLLTLSSRAGIKYFCFISGNNVYGTHNELNKETDILCPDNNNGYGLSKYVGELLVEDYCAKHNIDYHIIRIADIYGGDQKQGRLIKALVSAIINKSALQLWGKGSRTRDYIYVDDVIDGIKFILTQPRNQIFNLGTGVGTSAFELVELANELSEGACGVEKKVIEQEDCSRIVLDVSKLKKAGFEAKIKISDGLKLIVEENKNE